MRHSRIRHSKMRHSNLLPLIILFANPIMCLSPQPGEPIWNLAAQNAITLNVIESKSCELAAIDSTVVFTAIDPLNQKTISNDSLTDNIDSLVDDINEDFIDTRAALELALLNVCIATAELQSATDNVIDANAAIGQFITDADVGAGGFTISTPGKYILCEQIDTAASTAITIDADNVELNLNGFSIINADIAISIVNGASNFVIYNGFIANTTTCGIDIDDDALCGLIENIWIDTSGDNGIRCQIDCANIIMRKVRVTGASADGYFITQSSNIIMETCLATGNGSAGIYFGTGCSRLQINNCLSANNGPTGALGAIAFSNCTNVEVLNCFCANNNSISGINLETVDNALIRDNICNENGGEGIRVHTNSTQIKLIDNICIDNSGQGIELNDATNCFVFENIATLNASSANIDEQSGGPNSFLSNWALAAAGGDNYDSTSSTINQVTINQSIGGFPSEPTKWQNISMTT